MDKLLRTITYIFITLVSGVKVAFAQTVTDSLAIADTIKGRIMATDSLSQKLGKKVNIYDLPYSRRTSCPNWGRLWLNTGVLVAGEVTMLGILQLLPEDATAWNKESITSIPFWKRWSYHVRKGPVWDGDNVIFNYVLHPYAGAVYYMGARSLGFNQLGSFIYCFIISNVLWEYGIEAFMEKPSIQDLIVTPLSGLFIGECFYRLKRNIVSNGYRLWGSRTWGNIVAFIIDPVNEVIGLFAGNPCRKGLKQKRQVEMSSTPWVVPTDGGAFGLTVNITM